MNTRRFVMHLIVGLLAFLIGVTATMALGGFDPLARLSRRYDRRTYVIPVQSLSTEEAPERYSGCRHSRLRMRTAEMNSQDDLLIPPVNPPAPVAPVAPFHGEDVPPPPPRAPRAIR